MSVSSNSLSNSSWIISEQISIHSSQIYTFGPAISLRTCSWLLLQNEHFKTFLYKIETLSNLTWLDIIRLPRENGMENIKLKIQTPNFITDDIQLKSIRFGKLERMIGYKMDNVFYLLYIDIDGSCYSH